MSYHSVDAIVDDADQADDVEQDELGESGEPGEGREGSESSECEAEPTQMDISQAPEPEPGDVALPTMADLDEMVKALDEIDATLARLDSGELLDEIGATPTQNVEATPASQATDTAEAVNPAEAVDPAEAANAEVAAV